MKKLYLLFIQNDMGSESFIYDSNELREEKRLNVIKTNKYIVPEMSLFETNVDEDLFNANKLYFLHIVDIQGDIVSDIFRFDDRKSILEFFSNVKERYKAVHIYERNHNLVCDENTIFSVSSDLGSNYGTIKKFKTNKLKK